MDQQIDIFGGEVAFRAEPIRPTAQAPAAPRPVQLGLFADESREFTGQAGLTDLLGAIPTV